jgi:flagellar motor switch protein FliM
VNGEADVGRTSGEGRPAGSVLREILSGAARRLRARISTWSGRDAAVRVALPVETSLASVMLNAPESSLWARFQGREGPPALLVIEGNLLAALIGRLFGSAGVEAPRPPGSEPTEVERAVGARLCRELVDALCACWTGGPAPTLVIGEVAPSARVADDVDPDEPYLVTELLVGDPEEPLGTLRVAMPASLVRGASTVKPRSAPAPAPAPAARAPRYDRVLPIEIEVTVELARFQMSLGKLRTLAVGDELPLPALGEAIARVGTQAALVGEAGSRDGARSLRVTRRLSDSNLSGADR